MRQIYQMTRQDKMCVCIKKVSEIFEAILLKITIITFFT